MPQMTWQPAPSIPLASQPSSWRLPASCQSIPECCPHISFSACLFFSLLAACPAGFSCQASPVDLVTCQHHFSLRRFTVVKRSSWGPMACRFLFRTSSLEMWPVGKNNICSTVNMQMHTRSIYIYIYIYI